jgi:hypothetical protein
MQNSKHTFTPSPKSPGMETLLEMMAGRTTAITHSRCVNAPIGCGNDINGFRDAISAKEYTISGLCQACQDKIFGDGE